MANEPEKRIEPAILEGFLELLPAQQMLFDKMRRTIEETYELFGFIPLDTALIEKAEVLLAKSGGETGKQIFYLQRKLHSMVLSLDLIRLGD